MEFAKYIIGFQLLIGIISFCIIIYLIIRKYKIRKGDNFEKRDN